MCSMYCFLLLTCLIRIQNGMILIKAHMLMENQCSISNDDGDGGQLLFFCFGRGMLFQFSQGTAPCSSVFCFTLIISQPVYFKSSLLAKADQCHLSSVFIIINNKRSFALANKHPAGLWHAAHHTAWLKVYISHPTEASTTNKYSWSLVRPQINSWVAEVTTVVAPTRKTR